MDQTQQPAWVEAKKLDEKLQTESVNKHENRKKKIPKASTGERGETLSWHSEEGIVESLKINKLKKTMNRFKSNLELSDSKDDDDIWN